MTRSTVRYVEVQKPASPLDPPLFSKSIPTLHMVAVLTEAPDGWRCYEALHLLALDTWEEDKARAVEWTRAHGNKVLKEHVGRYFHGTAGLEFAR